jgi:hypothetical protein
MRVKKLLLLFLLVFAGFAFAQNPSEDIALNLRADTFYASPGGSIQVAFDIYNPLPSNDNVIGRIDVYIFGLKESGLAVESWQKNGWQHSYSERFGDQFFINNATSQPLALTLKAGSNLKTASLEGFYSFQKTTGTPALGDGVNFKIQINALQQGQNAPAPSKTSIPAKEQELNNVITALAVIVIILAIALVFLAARSMKKKQERKTEHHKK